MRIIIYFRFSVAYILQKHREIHFGDSLHYYVTDTGEELINTNFYKNGNYGSDRRCFMSFYGGVLKILAPVVICMHVDAFADASSAKIYVSNNPPLIRVNIINDKGKEINTNFAIPLQDLYDPERNILTWTDFNIKIYYYKVARGQYAFNPIEYVISDTVLIKRLNAKKTTNEKYNYEVNEKSIHFIDNGDDIFYYNSDVCLLVYNIEIFKFIVPNDTEKIERILHLEKMSLVCAIDGDGEGNDFWDIPKIRCRTEFYGLQFLPDPFLVSNIKDFIVKIYYKEDDNHIIFLKEMPLEYKMVVFKWDQPYNLR